MAPSLNIGYIFLRVFDTLASIPFDPNNISDTWSFLVGAVATTGMVLAVVLLVMIIYVRIRLLQVEHHGFLELEEKERAVHLEHTQAAKNPRWEMITSLASSPNESDWRRAIIEADIMLASLLTEQGLVGDGVGDQLKNANPLQFTTLDLAWEAHKFRNKIAHETSPHLLNQREVRRVITAF